MPIIESQSADAAVHRLCMEIATKCVWTIQACLRDEERHLALQEFYRICRENLDKPQATPEL